MLDKSLLAQVQNIYIKSRRLATEAFTGEFTSAFKGRGMEFAEVREYVPGDDIRTIDWNVTARLDKPFVKIYHEEREQSVMLLVDVSKSLDFGTNAQSKKKYATELAALLAYSANQSQDKVGLILFSDQIEEFIPPKKTRGHVWRVIRKILTHAPKGSGTALGAALKYLNETVRKSSITFIISDFLTDNYKEALKAAYMIHDLIPIVVRDPLENEFNHPHRFMLQDMESGASQEIDFSSKAHRDWFSKHRIEERTSLKRFFDHMGMDSLFLENGHDYMQPLIKLFRLRERR